MPLEDLLNSRKEIPEGVDSISKDERKLISLILDCTYNINNIRLEYDYKHIDLNKSNIDKQLNKHRNLDRLVDYPFVGDSTRIIPLNLLYNWEWGRENRLYSGFL